MSEFRLTQISDTHLGRRFPGLIANFGAVSEHIDADRPDLVINTGDVSFDGPTSRDDVAFAKSLHDALPVDCRYLPGNHDIGDNPTALGPAPKPPIAEAHRQQFRDIIGEDHWSFEAAGWRFIGLNSLVIRTCFRGRPVRLARVGNCAGQWQAGRAVPAQAGVSQPARRS
jgi:3',5'-cyclic AMP phosphodiesterase CpdA